MAPHIDKATAVLSVREMSKADELTIKRGTAGIELMRNAGAFCADAVLKAMPKSATLVLCGPGNNGGDGFVIARLMEEAGWAVSVSLLVTPDKLKGDARLAYEEWISAARSPVLVPFTKESLAGAGLVVDAIFGAGLSRDVSGAVADLIDEVGQAGIAVVAIDVPSGVDGNSGRVRGTSFKAEMTTTFFCKKPAHLLMPGRLLCGEVLVGDIGIEASVLDEIEPRLAQNDPLQWLAQLARPQLSDHKYARGHTLVVSGGVSHTGAARLAALSALRAGSGLVTVASPASALMVNAAHLTSVMVRSFSNLEGFQNLVADQRLNSFVIGPGNGVGETTRERVLHLLGTGRSIVLDADALTSFEEKPDALFEALHEAAVLTPHGGEFARLFPDLGGGDKLGAARAAAKLSGAIIVFKGSDTVIAHPDGSALINANAPASLATAGSGDVLAGLIAGLMAQGMSAFDAAAAGVWIHGEAANLFGLGLISEDLPHIVPEVLADLL